MKLRNFGVTVPRVAEFRIYASRSRKWYFDVFIFRDRRTMRRFWSETNARTGLRGSPRFEAVCRSWYTLKVRGRRSGSLGQVLFHARRVGAGIVSHEMTHAACAWLGRQRGKHLGGDVDHVDRRLEERFCHVQGYLVNQFWNEFYQRKLDKCAH